MTVPFEARAVRQSRWFLSVRTLWLAAALSALGLFVAAVPGYLSGFVFTAPVDAPVEYVSAAYSASVLASVVSALVSLVLAFILFLQKPKDRMAMYLSFYLLGYGVVMAGPLEALENVFHRPGSFSILAQTILLTAPTLAIFYLFPNGQFVPRGTRWLTLFSVVLIPAVAFYSTPDEWRTFDTPTAWAIGLALVILFLAGVSAQINRYRDISTRAERQQTKWVIFGLSLWMAFMALQGVPYVYLQQLPAGTTQPWWAPMSGAGWWLSLGILPLSLAIAVLRFHLFDIDLIIRRTLIYGGLTALLALVYFGSVVLLQQLFRGTSGAQQSEIVTILSTLAIAALFNPLRRRVQDGIDHRFYRRKYDAAQVLARFSVAARDEVELEKLTGELLDVVDETMQPAHVTLWIKVIPQ